MARMPRLLVPGYPHHVTQRGNRRMKTFFSAEDYRAYLDLIVECKDDVGVEVWAYCLMPNHVHLVVTPEKCESLSKLFRHVHRHYSRRINFRKNWKGHLWQERYHSFVMDERHLLATVRYTELNPVRARLCEFPEDWLWSSIHAHMEGFDDPIVSVKPMLDRVGDWSRYLARKESDSDLKTIRTHSGTGRPAGDDLFVGRLEALTGKNLKKGKPGPKPAVE
jgi:putative transposase